MSQSDRSLEPCLRKKRSAAKFPHVHVEPLARGGSAADYRDAAGADVRRRVADFAAWYDARLSHDLWPYNKSTTSAPTAMSTLIEETGRTVAGINLASQDYLSLAKHPHVVAAAIEAASEYGVHSSGSAILMGNTRFSRSLETRIGETLGYQHVLLYPTGWAAGFGVLRGLVRPSDHVVLDALAHNCLQEGAQMASRNVHLSAHISLKHIERTLKRIRREDTDNAIFVVSEGLFSMDSDTPDIARLQDLCREHVAMLVLDVAHDFGVLGAAGRSALEEAGMLCKVDVVMGSFSKTFASNGGFVCLNDEGLLKYLRVYSSSYLFSNALSPVQAASVLAAMDVAFSKEGQKRRRALFRNIGALRQGLGAGGLECFGRPSPIVPVSIGTEFEVRVANYLASEGGVLTNVAEYPVVPRGMARFRLQVQADHTVQQMRQAAKSITDAARSAREYCLSTPPVELLSIQPCSRLAASR